MSRRMTLGLVVAASAGVLIATAGPAAAVAAPRVAPHVWVGVPLGSPTGAVAYAERQLGKAYVWGTSGPATFDAPGLVQASYASVGITLPHSAALQAAQTTPVSRAELAPGDLVFYGATSPDTVAIYIGNDEIVGVFTAGTRVHVDSVDFSTVYGYTRVG